MSELSRRTVLSGFAAAALASFERAGLGRVRSGALSESDADWSNWSGAVSWRPRRVARPQTLDEVVAIVKDAVERGETVRAAGTGHSFTPLCATDGTTVLLGSLGGVRKIDASAATVSVGAGTKLYELEQPLREAGFALETLPDIDRQAVAGAVATATHGTGRDVPSLSSLVVGAKLVDGLGRVVSCDERSDAAMLSAVQTSLGALGVLTELTLRLVPAFRLHETTRIAPFEEVAESLDDLVAAHRHFEFFWVSDRDACLVKTLDPTDKARDFERKDDDQGLTGERMGPSGKIFPSRRNRRFNEIEYAVPADSGLDCWREIRELMRGRHKDITWPLEYRTVAAESAWLSMAHAEPIVTLSLHQAANLDFQPFFNDAEAVFRNHRGRPHWGKIHQLEAAELRELYPKWQQFLDVRAELDPKGTFATPYLKGLLGV